VIVGGFLNPELLASIEKRVGKTAVEISRASISELHDEAEKKLNARLLFKVRWPFVGRGNILKRRILTHDAVERLLDAALR
jgi:hypothetical protein